MGSFLKVLPLLHDLSAACRKHISPVGTSCLHFSMRSVQTADCMQISRVWLSSSVMFWKSFTDNHLILHEWRGNQVSVLNSINESSCLSSQKPPWMQLSQSDVYENKLIRQEAHRFRVCVWKHAAAAEPSLCSKCEGQVGWNLNVEFLLTGVSGGPKVAGLQVGGERRNSWG